MARPTKQHATKSKKRALSSRRKVGRAALSGIEFPTKRKFPTIKPKKGQTPSSGLLYRTSVVGVGMTADLLTDVTISSLVKRVADRARRHIGLGGKVSVRLMTLFAKLRSVIEIDDGEDLVITDLGEYDDDLFPAVGSDWEWRSRYSGSIVGNLSDLRSDVRSLLQRAREEDQDGNFVFVDAIELTKWTIR